MLNFLQSAKLEIFFSIFNKLVQKFLLVIAIFCCIFYIFEILKILEYFSKGIVFTEWVTYLGVNLFTFLPVMLPISLFIAVLLTYNALFFNNEFLLSYMLNLKFFFYPIILLGSFVIIFSFQVNFFLKPMASYQLKVMHNQFSKIIYKNKKAEVFQFGVQNSLFYAKEKFSNNFSRKVFLSLPHKKYPVSVFAQKSRTFLQKKNAEIDLMLELHQGKVYNLSTQKPFLYSFDKAQIFLKSLASTSIKPSLKYYTLLDLNLKNFTNYNILQKNVYKYKSINLIFACLSFCLLAWILLPMNFAKKKWQIMTAFAIIFIFWLLYSLCLGWVQSGLITPHYIYLIPNLWILLISAWLYRSRKTVALSERMLAYLK